MKYHVDNFVFDYIKEKKGIIMTLHYKKIVLFCIIISY